MALGHARKGYLGLLQISQLLQPLQHVRFQATVQGASAVPLALAVAVAHSRGAQQARQAQQAQQQAQQ